MPDLPRFIPPAEPSNERSGGSEDLRGNGSKDITVLLADVVALTRRLRASAQAQVQAERANEANHVMLAALAHELRAPLGTISLYAQLLREGDVVSRSDLQHVGHSLERAVKQQTQLIDQLLDGAHDNSGEHRAPDS